MEKKEYTLLHDLIVSSQSQKDKDDHPLYLMDAQFLILNELLKIPNSVSKLNESEKFYFYSFKKSADSILWFHLDHEPSSLRKFLSGEVTLQCLRHHNIESHVRFAENIYKEFNFAALVSDLCTSPNIGDVFVLLPGGIVYPIEIKFGEKNKLILEAIKEKELGNEKKYKSLVKDPSLKKQFERVEKQNKKLKHITELYYFNKAETDDLHSEIFSYSQEALSFESEVDRAIEVASSEGSAVRTIDPCLKLIAMSVNKGLDEKLLQSIIPTDSPFLVSFYSKEAKEKSLTKPILTLDMDIERKFALLSSDFLVMMVFLPDIFCEVYSSKKCVFKIRTIAAKETGLRNDQNQIVIYLNNKETIPLGPGLYQRMLGCFTHPKTVAAMAEFLGNEFQKIAPD